VRITSSSIVAIITSILVPMRLLAISTVFNFTCSGLLAAQEVILSNGPDPLSPYTNADIMAVGNTSIMALRTVDTGKPVYTFTLENENLLQVLRVLASTLLPPGEITTSPFDATNDSDENSAPPAKPTLSIQDGAAYVQDISFSVNEADINTVLDQAAIASNCNIYIEGLIITVDRCE
jgi:hypothetical protein